MDEKKINCTLLREKYKVFRKQGETCSRLLVTKGLLSNDFIESFRLFEKDKHDLRELIEEYFPIYLLENENLSICAGVLKNPNIPIEKLFESYSGLTYDKDDDRRDYIIESLLQNPNLPIELLRRIADNEESPRALFHIASHPDMPAEYLRKFLEHDDVDVYSATFQNRNLVFSSEELENIMLKRGADTHVLSGLAENPNTPVTYLVKFLKNRDYYVSFSAAGNPNLPAEEIEKIEREQYTESICKGFARNPNTPVEILSDLLTDSRWERFDECIPGMAAKNPNLPVWSIKEILRDSAKKNKYILEGIAKNPNTPVEDLEKLASNRNHSVRASIACNPKISGEILSELTRDKDYFVRLRASENPNALTKELRKLLKDANNSVRKSAAGHPNIIRKFSKGHRLN